jgi:50S ribosomal subunit-associated GTPase HflX
VNSEGKKISLFLIGNKIDLLERKITKDDGNDKASFYGMKYFEISCKLNINITEISARIIEECYTEIEKQNGQQKVQQMNDSNNFKLNKSTQKKDKKKKKKFC